MAPTPLTKKSKWGHLIEILWNVLKDDLAARYTKLQDSQELRSMALEEWNQVRLEKIVVVTGSMPRRIEACIRDNGGSNFNFKFLLHDSIVLLYLLSLSLPLGCHFETLLLCYSRLFGGACGC